MGQIDEFLARAEKAEAERDAAVAACAARGELLLTIVDIMRYARVDPDESDTLAYGRIADLEPKILAALTTDAGRAFAEDHARLKARVERLTAAVSDARSHAGLGPQWVRRLNAALADDEVGT